MVAIPVAVLGVAWGALVAAPIAARAHRLTLAERLDQPTRRGTPSTRVHLEVRARSLVDRALAATGPVGRVVGSFGRTRRGRRDDAALERELPIAIDLLGVAVGAGCTPYLAVEIVSRWSSPAVAARFASVLGACALGASFDTALDTLARSSPRLRPLVDALLASDRLGVPVGPALARLAAEERGALRRRAEAHARRVPVRLLVPLTFLVLPAFVLITVVPGLAAGLARL